MTIILRIILLNLLAIAAADGPPVAPIHPVSDTYFGTTIVDPYRYMENLDDPQVQAWIKSQADCAQHILHEIPGRDRLLTRIQELNQGAPYRFSIVHRWQNGDLHYTKRLASENIAKLYFHDAKSNQDRLLVDPDRFIEAGKSEHFSIEFAEPSSDERYVAYGISASGSEQTTLHVLDLQTGKDLPDTIDRMEAGYLVPRWLPDSSGFVYGRRRKLPADAPATEGYKQTRALLHRLGTDPDADPLILAMGTTPAIPLSETDFPAIEIEFGSHFIVAQIKHGDDVLLTLYSAPLDSLTNANIPWKKICDVDDGVEEYRIHGDDIYLRTSNAAPRYRIVKTSLANPDFSHAQTVVPQTAIVISAMQAARDAMYISLLDAGLERVSRLSYDSPDKLESIEVPPGFASAELDSASNDTDGALVYTDSWVRGGVLCSVDPQSHHLIDTHLQPPGKFDNVPGYQADEVLVPGYDGVKVPLSILHKTAIALDGSHPTLISGYGAYGISETAYFSPSRLAWLERGGVLAIAHVRGGGEYGEAWHRAGQKLTKPNTWKDFLACSEYLIHEGYTSPTKLAGAGGSAGGILIGRAITERPDLFAAALIQVGCSDMLRFETTTNGVPNIPEFGSVTTHDGFQGLLEMSSYAHIFDGVKYPAVLLTHGINDPRVAPWNSAKMCARLQAATASGKPILLRIDYDAGHGIGSTRSQRENELADQWAFLLWQMGERY
jgi:prolyl oligopeptidase